MHCLELKFRRVREKLTGKELMTVEDRRLKGEENQHRLVRTKFAEGRKRTAQ